MPSSRHHAHALLALLLLPAAAAAGTPVPGFALERFVPPAPDNGYLALDELALAGPPGAGVAFTLGYAHHPLVVTGHDGATSLKVVASQAFLDLGLGATWERFRVTLGFTTPVWLSGQSGSVDGFDYTAPQVSWASHPDTLADLRVGLDVLLAGAPGEPFRLAASGKLFIPSGEARDYLSDGTFRGQALLLAAGDAGRFGWAAQVGFHLRPLDLSPAPGGPHGGELLFGLGARALVELGGPFTLSPGLELLGQTDLDRPFSADTGLELLAGATLEGLGPARFKLGVGAGLDPRFGTPLFRVLVAVELFGRLEPKPEPSPAGPPRTARR